MRLADYSQNLGPDATIDAKELDSALRAGGFAGVFHYLSGDFALRIESPAVVASVRTLGWPQIGIDVPSLASVDGGVAATIAIATYGWRSGQRLMLDVEPGEFRAAPIGWAAASDRWCDAVRSLGLSPGVYGTDATVAACGSRADWIERALPGQCDPAAPGLDPTFKAGQRAVQCTQETWAGIVFDVVFTQFEVANATVGGSMAEGFMSPDPGNDVLQELFLGFDGNAYFADYGQGGAGGFEAFSGSVGSFGAPVGHRLVKVGGTYTTYQDQQRLNIWGVVEDGSRWVKVVRYVQPYDVLQDWAPTASPTLARVEAVPPDDDTAYVTQAAFTAHEHDVTASGTSGAPK